LNRIKKKLITGALLGIIVIAILLACLFVHPYIIHETDTPGIFLNNKDGINHSVNIKIFDSKNVPIFENHIFWNQKNK